MKLGALGRIPVGIVELHGEIIGYGSLLRWSKNTFFLNENIPEINALWIDKPYRRQGYARALIEWIESLAREEGYRAIGIAVGLYRD